MTSYGCHPQAGFHPPVGVKSKPGFERRKTFFSGSDSGVTTINNLHIVLNIYVVYLGFKVIKINEMKKRFWLFDLVYTVAISVAEDSRERQFRGDHDSWK